MTFTNPITFTLDAGPGTSWKVRVIVHPNRAAMHKARNKNEAEPIYSCQAYCRQYGVDLAWKEKSSTHGFAAEINFYRQNIKRGWVIHEALHAALAYARLCIFDLSTGPGEEQLAESVEHISEGVLWFLRKNKIKVK